MQVWLVGALRGWKGEIVGSEKRCRLHCNHCGNYLKYSFQEFQSIYQYSNKSKDKSLSNVRFGNNCRRFLAKDTTVSSDKTSPSSSQNHHITFDLTLKEKVSDLEALWVFKVAQDDLSLGACDEIPSLFQKMFPDSNHLL